MDSTRTRELFPVWGAFRLQDVPDVGNSYWWRGTGPRDPEREGLCHQIQRQGFRHLGTSGMNPGMAPDGQGRWDCPTNVCTILTEGFQGRESPPGTPSLLPPPTKKKHQHVAPISLGDGDCVEGSWVERDGAPALASDGGGDISG